MSDAPDTPGTLHSAEPLSPTERLTSKGPLPLELIVAVGRGRVIGQSGTRLGLPWHIPEDLKHFKKHTVGRPIVMGRTTHEAIGRPLPRRRNLVLSRRAVAIEGCEVYPDLTSALEAARRDGDVPVICGGASVYEEALPLVTTIHLTEVDREVVGDAFFPPLGPEFVEVARRAGETEDVSFVRLERRALSTA